jgi:hypothetical protein
VNTLSWTEDRMDLSSGATHSGDGAELGPTKIKLANSPQQNPPWEAVMRELVPDGRGSSKSLVV